MRRALAAAVYALACSSALAVPFYQLPTGNDAKCNGTANVAYPGSGGPGLNCAEATVEACIADITRLSGSNSCNVGSGVLTDPALKLGACAGTSCTLQATVPGTDINDSATYSARIDQTGASIGILVTGNNWTIRGFYVRVYESSTAIFIQTGSDTGISLVDNRIEIQPGRLSEVLFVNGTSNVNFDHNWIQQYPGCINGGQTYTSPWTGGPVTPVNSCFCCTGFKRCDKNNAGATMIAIMGNGGDSGVTITRSSYGHWRQPVVIRNFSNVTISRNYIENGTNHGGAEVDDVSGVLMENNILATIGTGECADDIPVITGALLDTYCIQDVIIRNNTVVGHDAGVNVGLLNMDPQGTRDVCVDALSPNVNDDGTSYDFIRMYNNIVYDNRSSGGSQVQFKTGLSNPTSPGPCCYSDYNLLSDPGGGRYGQNDPDGPAGVRDIDYTSMSKACPNPASWRCVADVDGDGITWDFNSQTAAPQFVDYANGDYRPASAEAPQVNTGINTVAHPCPTVDYYGNPRGGSNGACDIGAVEFQAAGDPCVDIACTSAALEIAISALNAGSCPSNTITFNCSNTTIPIAADVYPSTTHAAARVVRRANGVIDGETNNLKFDMSLPWWDNDLALCSGGGGNCDPGNTGVPTLCPDVHDSNTSQWFILLRGANSKVKNLTYRYFMEGVRLEAAGAEIDHVRCIVPGDDCASNPGKHNVIIRNSTLTAGCDKNIQAYGDEKVGGTAYDMAVYDSTFLDGDAMFRVSGNGTSGRFLLDGNTFKAGNMCVTASASMFGEPCTTSADCGGGECSTPVSGIFKHRGPHIGDANTRGGGTPTDDLFLYLRDNEINGTNRGMRIDGDTQVISLGGNRFINNQDRGIVFGNTSRGLIQGDTFTNNGGSTSPDTGNPPFAGGGAIAVGNTAVVDAGRGSQTLDGVVRGSNGGNVFTGNHSATLPNLQFDNETGSSMSAQCNTWNDADPSDEVFGIVSYTLLASACAAPSAR